jgi:protein-tyrosine-phosphatase
MKRGQGRNFSEVDEIATSDVLPRLAILAQRGRQLVARLGQLIERLLHAYRRRKARRQLAAKHIRSVLFLCHGNVYRSPYAAAALKHALAATPLSASIKVVSAGFTAPGRRVPEGALSAARTRGIDLSSHLSTLVTAHAVADMDLVAVMSHDQARGIGSRHGPAATILILGDLDPLPIRSRTITDPLGRDADVVEEVYSRIDRCVEQLAELIAKSPRRLESLSYV